MNLSQALLAETAHEFASTRRVLEGLPPEKADWQPYDKGMTLGQMAIHVATLPLWGILTLAQDELDLGQPFPPQPKFTDEKSLLALFDMHVSGHNTALAAADNETLMKPWTLKKGDQVLMTLPKAGVLRTTVYNHLYHHRGQLVVYRRLLGLEIPVTYFNTADSPGFQG